jgi:PAS domain S-box-containing protein
MMEKRKDEPPEQRTPPAQVAAAALTAERALELLWQQAPDFAFVLMDRTGSVIGWRAASEKIFGYSETEMLGGAVDILFTEEDRALGLPQLEREVALSAQRSEDDRWHVRKDGTRIWVFGSLIALREADRHVGFAKVMSDRTNLRAQLETLGNRLDSAHDALRGRDAFFGRVTHEIRNALGPIRNATDLVERKGLLTGELEVPFGIVRRQVVQMARMLEDLAEVVRFGAGKLQLVMQSFDLGAELVEIAATVAQDAESRNQTIAVLVPPAPLPIVADKARVHQIVFNLLHNAIKYTPPGGRIWLQCTAEADHAVIKVEDTGVGIAPSLLPRIFELFTQEDPHQSGGGFGVGLSLVKDLVDAHRGFVEVRCDGKHRGSEFTVRLPLRPVLDRAEE